MNWSTRLRRWVRIRTPPVREASTKPTAATVLPAPVACSNQKRRLGAGVLGRLLDRRPRPRARSSQSCGSSSAARARRPPRPLSSSAVAVAVGRSSSSSARAARSAARPPAAAPRCRRPLPPLLLGDQRGQRSRERVDLVRRRARRRRSASASPRRAAAPARAAARSRGATRSRAPRARPRSRPARRRARRRRAVPGARSSGFSPSSRIGSRAKSLARARCRLPEGACRLARQLRWFRPLKASCVGARRERQTAARAQYCRGGRRGDQVSGRRLPRSVPAVQQRTADPLNVWQVADVTPDDPKARELRRSALARRSCSSLALAACGSDGGDETARARADYEKALAGAPPEPLARAPRAGRTSCSRRRRRLRGAGSPSSRLPGRRQQVGVVVRPLPAEFPFFQQPAASSASGSRSSASTPTTPRTRRGPSSTSIPVPYPSYSDPDEEIAERVEGDARVPLDRLLRPQAASSSTPTGRLPGRGGARGRHPALRALGGG